MLIYGTGSFNRRDYSLVRSTCSQCGKRGYQRSYTSTRFFTLYFLPIFPFRRQRITCECPNCKATRGLKYSEWKRLSQTAVPQAAADYEASPSDREKAFALLAATAEAQDRSTLARLGPQIAAAFPRDEKLLASLANMYSYLCMDEQADDAFLKAVDAGSDEEVTAVAQAHMEHRSTARPKPPNRLLQSFPVFIVPGALLSIVCFTLLSALSPLIDDAYFINGLERPYSIVVNGEPVSLPPYQDIPATMLTRGENTIDPGPDAPFQDRRTLNIEKSFGQAFSDDVIIINPDRAAVLLYERTPYSDTDRYNDDYSYAFHVGDDYYRFENINYAFLPFPDEIDIPPSGSVVYKTRLSSSEFTDPIALANTMLGDERSDLLRSYLKAKVRGGDDGDQITALAATHLDGPDFMELAEPCLEERPIRMTWHRYYQMIAETNSDIEALRARYRALSAAEPASSDLLYLRGRVEPDPRKQLECFEKAWTMSSPSPYAAHAVGYHYLLKGDYTTAFPYSDAASRALPDDRNVAGIRTRILHGLGNYELLEDEFASKATSSQTFDFIAAYEHLYSLAKLDRPEQIAHRLPWYLSRYRQERQPDEAALAQAKAYLESAIAYARNDPQALLAIAHPDTPQSQFLKAVASGDIGHAISLQSDFADHFTATDRLLLYILATRRGDNVGAQTALAAAIDILRQSSSDARSWAEWFEAPAPPDLDLAGLTCADIDNHFLYLAALAHRHPACAGAALQHAQALRTVGNLYYLATSELFPAPRS